MILNKSKENNKQNMYYDFEKKKEYLSYIYL